MKISKLQMTLFAGAIILSANALAGTFTFVAKQTDAKGQMHYVYKFFCSNRAEGQFSVVAANDDVAKKAAEQKVKVVCEE